MTISQIPCPLSSPLIANLRCFVLSSGRHSLVSVQRFHLRVALASYRPVFQENQWRAASSSDVVLPDTGRQYCFGPVCFRVRIRQLINLYLHTFL